MSGAYEVQWEDAVKCFVQVFSKDDVQIFHGSV